MADQKLTMVTVITLTRGYGLNQNFRYCIFFSKLPEVREEGGEEETRAAAMKGLHGIWPDKHLLKGAVARFFYVSALSLKHLGPHTKFGSSLLVMAIIGGAVFRFRRQQYTLRISRTTYLSHLRDLLCTPRLPHDQAKQSELRNVTVELM